jgi:hypothetical protein
MTGVSYDGLNVIHPDSLGVIGAEAAPLVIGVLLRHPLPKAAGARVFRKPTMPGLALEDA